MKRMPVFLLLLVLLLSSCSEVQQTVEYQGRRLSDSEILEHIQSELSGKTETSQTHSIKPWKDGIVCSMEDRVYWTKSGSVYHTNINCRYLPDDAELIYGSEEDAVSCGKKQCCSLCAKEK